MERVSNRCLLQFCKCRTDGVAVFALICIALLLAPSMRAQSRRPELPWAMSARIGAVGNAYENAYSYFKHSKGHDLITMTFVADAQHDFTDAFALRLSSYTRQPWRASCCAVLSPIPLVPPVISTILSIYRYSPILC